MRTSTAFSLSQELSLYIVLSNNRVVFHVGGENLKIFILILSFAAAFSAEAVMLKNKLKNHASPYLAMHGTDPVAWQEWNKETLKRAQNEEKLIYVSSGYFSCHWCHVMQRESYKNKDIAKILNTYFIPVKIDREISSALDSRLIDFVERTQGRAGWPLNVFILPDGTPLVGLTYMPANNFMNVLENIKNKWGQEKYRLKNIAQNTIRELSPVTAESSEKLKSGLGEKYINNFLSAANMMSDSMSGGFGQQNKFPLFPQLKVMLMAYENKPNNEIKQFLLLTLNKMASQGLNDHLSGGFFRYTVDPDWQVPHFEKMLYDNALLASLYIDAARIFKNEEFARVAKDTLNFMLEYLRSEKGAYIASLSAVDNKGIEGGGYLWQRDELNKILTKDEIAVVSLIWELNGVPSLDGGHHLAEVMNVSDVAKLMNISQIKVKEDFNLARNKMLFSRNKRNIPRDDKLLAGWNALALSAYAKAAKQFESERYAKAARDIKNYIYQSLWQSKRLVRAIKDDIVLAEGGLEDYAYMAQGLYDWLEYSNNKQDQQWLKDVIDQAWKRFYSEQGWSLEENSLLKYGQNIDIIFDGVLPSASATLINISLKQAEKNKDSVLEKKALKALNVAHAEVVSQPFMYASHILALFEYQKRH